MAIGKGDEGIFAVVEAIIFEAPGMIARGVGRFANAVAAGMTGGENSLSEGHSFTIGSFFGGGDKHETTHAPSRSQEVSVNVGHEQQQIHDPHHVDPHDLGNFSAPSFSVKVNGPSQGVSMNS